jgi:hypothetical protein
MPASRQEVAARAIVGGQIEIEREVSIGGSTDENRKAGEDHLDRLEAAAAELEYELERASEAGFQPDVYLVTRFIPADRLTYDTLVNAPDDQFDELMHLTLDLMEKFGE